MAQEPEQKGNTVRHPNLLLNQTEIDEIKGKVREHAWATLLPHRVKAKAEKDGAAIESALAYALTDGVTYALSGRNRLLREARDQMPRYEELDVNAEPEWGRWNGWGAVAWAYDLAQGP